VEGEIVKIELAGWTVYNETKKVFKSSNGWSKKPSIFMKKDEAEEEAKKYKDCIKKDVHFCWLQEY
jgi:hypothetical protein